MCGQGLGGGGGVWRRESKARQFTIVVKTTSSGFGLSGGVSKSALVLGLTRLVGMGTWGTEIREGGLFKLTFADF